MNAVGGAIGPNPWSRYGWLMGTVWLVFLGYTIADIWHADSPLPLRVIALAGIGAFMVVYVQGFRRLTFTGRVAAMQARAWRYLVLMALLAVPACLIAEGAGLGVLPYIVAFAMFTLALRWVAAITIAALAVTLLAAAGLFWQGAGGYAPAVALVAVVTGLVRAIDERDERHRATAKEFELVGERERVARDVHDVLGHSLTVLSIKAELAERLLDADPERARAELREIQSLTRESLVEIRATVAGLRVARLGDELESAEKALTAAGIEAEIPEGPEEVDPRHRLVLAWVLREAVTNVVRHSGAGTCTVTLTPHGMTVRDDGRGRDDVPEGNGLRGIRERVIAAGGTLTVTAGRDGSGTELEVAFA